MVTLALAGAALTLASLLAAGDRLPTRPNFAGKTIPTSTGICFLPIILLTLIFGLAGTVDLGRGGLAFALYPGVAAVVGFYDDVGGGDEARGFKGHVGALLVGGRVTTGLVKAVVLGVAAVSVGGYLFGFAFRGLFGAFLLAGCANLGNLFDVRPGRAIKFTGVPILALLFVAPGWAVAVVAGVLGGAGALFYFDLKGRIMLGDAGAAVVGSTLGCLVVASGPGVLWWVAGAVVVVLTCVAEFSSITRLIEEVGALRWFDLLGRGRGE